MYPSSFIQVKELDFELVAPSLLQHKVITASEYGALSRLPAEEQVVGSYFHYLTSLFILSYTLNFILAYFERLIGVTSCFHPKGWWNARPPPLQRRICAPTLAGNL